MQETGQIDSGCYVLVIRLAETATIPVGALGPVRFEAGWYLYTGRAARNLGQRVSRHLRSEKKLRWHIDYLLTQAKIADVVTTPSLAECHIAASLAEALRAEPVAGFGASDCRCGSHLVRLDSRPAANRIRSLINIL